MSVMWRAHVQIRLIAITTRVATHAYATLAMQAMVTPVKVSTKLIFCVGLLLLLICDSIMLEHAF